MVKDNPQCVRHLDWILLDEAQDSDEMQFEFLFDMINPDYFFVCGDIKQAIYLWKGSKPERLLDLTRRPGVHVCRLNENYRNGARILNYAKELARKGGYEDDSIPVKWNQGQVYKIPFDLNGIVYEIKNYPFYKEWAILCRYNEQVQKVIAALKYAGIPYDTFKQGDLKKEELVEIMDMDTVKVLTVHSAKGLEWERVIFCGNRCYSQEEKNIQYVAATRAKDFLYWVKL